MQKSSLTKRDLLNVIAGALIAIVATGFYDCLFYFQKTEFENFNHAFIATLGTLGLFIGYAIFFFVIYPSSNKQTISSNKDSKDSEIKQNTDTEKEFQFELSELQREYDKVTIIITVIGISLALLGTIGAILYTSIEQSLKTYLAYVSIIPIFASIILAVALIYQYKIVISKKSKSLKEKFIYS